MLNAVVVFLALGAPTGEPATVSEVSPEDIRRMLAFLVKTAQKNRALAQPRMGDALTDHYVRQMARFAQKEKLAPKAFLVALGIGLDSTDVLRSHRLTGWYLKQVESDKDRQLRLRVLGDPSLKGRSDWLQHFAVSAALTVHVGPAIAEQAGIWKELRDSRGGSGFSFADLAADNAGICFARTFLDPGRDEGQQLEIVAKEFRGAPQLPPMKGFEEDISNKELTRRFGEPTDLRFLNACEAVRLRVEKLPAFRGLSKVEPGKKDATPTP